MAVYWDTSDAEDALREMESEIASSDLLNEKQKQKVIDAITKTETALGVALDTYEIIEEEILEAQASEGD